MDILILKIEFLSSLTLIAHQQYNFHNKNNANFFIAEFVGNSRIDGFPIFKIDKSQNITDDLSSYVLNNIDIKNINIITPLEDQNAMYEDAAKMQVRTNKLIDYILSKYKLNKEDILKDDVYDRIVRDLLITDIIE